MAWTQKQLVIAIVMVITGSINTLSTKWADELKSPGEDGGEDRDFKHPYLQACSMFLGELSCLIVFKLIYYYKKRRAGELEDVVPLMAGNQSFNPLIFFPPAMCDMLGTSTMYMGLSLTYASSFQMLRGAVIVFTGLLSVAFLHRTLKPAQWTGIFFIITGLAIVGCSDFVFADGNDTSHPINNVITGDLLIVMAQIIVATQMVYEEKFVNKHNIPALQAVGWEGFFGFVTLAILLVPMYYIHVPAPFGTETRGVLEDALDGFAQLSNNPELSVAFTGTIISIAFFNFAGVSVTKELSATTRMVLDSVRTVVIWVVALGVGWQKFNYMQVIGFLTLLIGMCLYNNIFIVPTLRHWGLIPSGRRAQDIHPPSATIFEPPITPVPTTPHPHLSNTNTPTTPTVVSNTAVVNESA